MWNGFNIFLENVYLTVIITFILYKDSTVNIRWTQQMQAQVKQAFIRFLPAFIAFSVYLIRSLWRRANARNVSLLTLYGGQFTFSTQLLTLNYLFTREPPRKRKRLQDFPPSALIGCFPALRSVWTRVSRVFSRLDTGKLLTLTLCRSNYLKTSLWHLFSFSYQVRRGRYSKKSSASNLQRHWAGLLKLPLTWQ